jgi:hypothetical protein
MPSNVENLEEEVTFPLGSNMKEEMNRNPKIEA